MFKVKDDLVGIGIRAANKKLHTCQEDCGTGVVFCFTTVTFGDPSKVQYVKSPQPPKEWMDQKTGKKVLLPSIVAQYGPGSVTLTCHCFGLVQYLGMMISGPITSSRKEEALVSR